jgi:hypothetical protein
MIVVAALVLPLVPTGAMGTAAFGAVTDRECADDSNQLPNRFWRCVNGSEGVTARGPDEVMLRCLNEVNMPAGSRFPRQTCSNSSRIMAERIAQARFIQWLDKTNRVENPAPPMTTTPGDSAIPGVTGVHPGVQWEIPTSYFPAKYADVLDYSPSFHSSPDPSRVPMDLFELKTSVNYGSYAAAATSASEQAWAYSEVLKYERVLDKNDPDAESQWASMEPAANRGYTDSFVVEKRTCSETDARGKPVKSAIDHEYQVFDANTFAGAVIAARTVKEYKCREDRQRENEVWREEQPYEANRWWLSWTRPEQDTEPVDPNSLVVVPQWVCSLTRQCVEMPAPERERVYTNAALLRTDVRGQDEWSERGPALCEAVALVEQRTGGNPVASTACDEAAAFPDLMNNAVFSGYLDSLDTDTWRTVMRVVWTWTASDAADAVTTPARVTGDPHLITLDGLNYDMQTVGEFTLLSVPEREVEVQARFVPAGATQSSIESIATEWGGTTVEIHANGVLVVGGETVVLDEGAGFPGGEDFGGYFVNDGGTYRLSWESGIEGDAPVTLAWEPMGGLVGSFGADVPTGVTTAGLLGNNDGLPLNDLVRSDGASVAADDVAEIHGGYADSWRIHGALSSFTYADGESTETYTDLAFPENIVTAGDFSESERAEAQEVCRQANVPAGPSFDDCELDVLATGNWTFAAAAATVTVPSIVAGDHLLDQEGRLGVDFQTPSLPANLAPLRVGDDPGIGRFAGPFSGTEQYRFYVPRLPNHDGVTLQFDAYATGAWDPQDDLTVTIDDGTPTPIDVSAGDEGVLASGVPFRKVRVEIPVEHHSEMLTVAFSATGLAASAGQGFAVDDVTVSADLVPAETFSVDLGADGASVSLREPTLSAGSGGLENRGSQDRYPVTVPAGRDLFLDWQTTSSTVRWSVLAADGAVVAGRTSAEGDARVEDLDGSYTLVVDVAGEAPPQSQLYSLDLMIAPDPQHFELTLPGPVLIPDDLPSPAAVEGAGVLETKASTDVYAFSVLAPDRDLLIEPDVCPREGWRNRLSWAVHAAGEPSPLAQGACGQQSLAGLHPGDYELRITPEREVPGAYRIRVAQDGPTVAFATEPVPATKETTLSFDVAGDESAQGLECALDAPSYVGPFTSCSSPVVFSELADGEHVVRIRATGSDGHPGPATTHRVTVDTAVPNLVITRKPPAVSNVTGPVLEYAAEKPGMQYVCSLVPFGSEPSFVACNGVSVYRNLAHGSYRFTVTGTDWVGNAATISYDFMVDMQPPVITLTTPPNLTSTTAPAFTFSADEQATFECSLVATADADSFTPCTSPVQYSGLTDGSPYRFFVRATDVAGQWSARGVTWTPYSAPPTVTLTSRPAASSTNSSPQFAFSTNLAQATFECSLVPSTATATFAPCSSPASYSGKAPGTYRFTVKAIDASGSWVSTSYQFTIAAAGGDTTAPSAPGAPVVVLAPSPATIGAATDNPASGVPLRITWSTSTDNVGVAGYQLWYSTNGGALVQAGNATGSGITMTLSPGTTVWQFQVTAFDAAGNTRSSPASVGATVALEQETASSRLTYAGTWTTASDSGSSGGSTRHANATAASATFKPAVGTVQIAVVMATGPAAGRATITVDGGSASTVDLYAATPGYRRMVLTSAVLGSGTAHTVVVRPTGTKNAASSGTRVDLDGFVTRR